MEQKYDFQRAERPELGNLELEGDFPYNLGETFEKVVEIAKAQTGQPFDTEAIIAYLKADWGKFKKGAIVIRQPKEPNYFVAITGKTVDEIRAFRPNPDR